MAMSFGPPAGSPFAGPSGGGAGSGLPFAGIPPELAARAKAVLDSEPEHPEPDVAFTQHSPETERFTLRRFLRPRGGALAITALLVVVETLTLQAGPLLTQIGIDRGIGDGDLDVLWTVTALFAVAIAAGVVISAVRISFTARLGESLLEHLRVRVFSHLQRQSLDFYAGEKSGRVMTRMTSDIDALTALFHDGLVNLAVQGLTLVVITAVLFWMNPTLALIVVIGIVPVMVVLTWWFRNASERGYNRVRDRIADVLADLSESLAGIRIIAAHNRRRHNVIVHDNVVGAHREANLETARIGAIFGPGTDAIGIAGQALVVLVGGRMVLDGTLTIGELTAFVLYLTAFFAPVQQLVQLYNTYQQGQAAVRKLADLLATEPSVPEAVDAVELGRIDGDVRFENVSFAYEPTTKVLDGVDLHIAPGEVFALVGPTGGGKSTLAKLIGRFHDPSAGRVLVDGHDLRTVTLASLRTQLGTVPQEPFLFHGTIRDNVTFARPDMSDDEVADACAAVGLDEVVARLPDGLDTAVHERGSSLSAGERQLVALARAFVARPRVLVLDEATSNLDLRSEQRIERALDVLLEGRTAIIIAHRLSTARRADRIAVVAEGGIAEIGTHDELVAADGRYAALYRTWTAHGAHDTDAANTRRPSS